MTETSEVGEAERVLRSCLDAEELQDDLAPGKAAFYGPKIDVQMRIGEGAEASIASIQLDFNSASKFDLSYVSNRGRSERPWIIHRAPFGSHESFIALLLKYFDGQLPGWLSPIRVYFISLSESERALASALARQLQDNGIRASVHLKQGSVAKRVRFARRLRPFSMLIIGPKEVSANELILELRSGKRRFLKSNLVGVLKKLTQGP